ncbi:MAG: hypothetical protein O3C21_17680 [Verrucomicrobia bacterium]|nr:hypothetical protein [Verrucomicrobiota bacterium]
MALGLGFATIGKTEAQTQIGIGSDLPAGAVDGAGSRMNIENADDTFPQLLAGTYDVTAFEYSTSADVGDIQPFLAVITADDEYSVIWVGPTAESPGTDDIATTRYEAGAQQFTLEDSAEVYAGFNAAGPIVKFGAGLTDHANPANFDIEPDSGISGFGHANLGRSYAFHISVQPSSSEIASIVLDSAVTFPTRADKVVLSSAAAGTPVGSLKGLNEFGGPIRGLDFALVAGEGDTNNGIYSIGGPDGDQLLVNASLAGMGNSVQSARINAEGEDGSFAGAVTFTVKLDSDNDGLIDDWEAKFGTLGDFATGGDHDADGLADGVEFGLGLNPADADADADGSLDGQEIANGTDLTKADTDGDGLKDGDEAKARSNPLVTDTDGDGIGDGDEVSVADGFVTDPTLADTDGDGFDDDVEIAANSDPTKAASQPSFVGAIGIGADHPAGNVDSAGSRMNIENADDTFPTLRAGTYDVAAFEYSTSSDVADIQPFLAVSIADDEYSVIWVGPTEESPGTDDIVTTRYEGEGHQFTLDEPAPVYAGFNAAGTIVKFGDGLTDHANPANFDIEPSSEISGFGHANLGRSYAFQITVVEAVTVDFEITDVVYTDGEPTTVTLTFNSSAGRTYSIASTALQPDGEAGGWVELDDSVPSQGTETLYSAEAAGPGPVFYQVREVP